MKTETENHYREELIELRRSLSRRLLRERETIASRASAAGLSHLPTHMADADDEGVDEEIEIVANLEATASAVDDALRRMDEGTYGTCADCGRPIPARRLEILPQTSRCAACALRLER